MYTNQELNSIVSRLSSFTPEELNYLKTKIDFIIGEKAIADLSINQHDSQKNVGYRRGVIQAFARSMVRDQKLEIQAESEDIKPDKNHRRPSGMWKGKVKMPDDFDELSNDILADFGID